MEVRLHYIGRRFYSTERFIEEARRYGVSRALPASVIKSLKWGDVIFLAQYEKGGIAHIFGFMRVTGLSVIASRRVREIARQRLSIDAEYSGSGRAVVRACGSYVVMGTLIVKDALEDVVRAYEAASKECKEGVAFLLDGDLTLLRNPIIIEGMKFARGILRVPIADEELADDDRMSVEEALCLKAEQGEVHLVLDYQKQRYLPRSATSCLPLDYFE